MASPRRETKASSRDASFSVSEISLVLGKVRNTAYRLCLFFLFVPSQLSSDCLHALSFHAHASSQLIPNGTVHPICLAMAHNYRSEINSCSDGRDWERLHEIRESIVNRAPIYVTPSLVSQSQSQSQPPPPSQLSLRAQPILQPSYYQAPRPQTPPSYAMGSYNQPGYGGLNGLRSQNPPPVAYPAPTTGASSRLRPNAGLVAPAIAYKQSPFYELKYQVGDVKTLEGASRVTRFLLAANALVANWNQ